MKQIDVELHKKVLAAAYEVDELWKYDLYIEWKKARNTAWLFYELKLNYLEVKRSLQKYLDVTNDHNLMLKVLISRNQRVLTQKLSNFLFSCDKFKDCQGKNKYESEIDCFFLHLRNYVTHAEPFPLLSVLNLNIDGSKRFESFSKKKLLEYLQLEIEKYKRRDSLKLAKKFLIKLNEKPDISPLIDIYYTSIFEDFFNDYMYFFKENKERFEEFFKKIEEIEEKNKSLKVMGLTPPLRASEIRLIRYLINK